MDGRTNTQAHRVAEISLLRWTDNFFLWESSNGYSIGSGEGLGSSLRRKVDLAASFLATVHCGPPENEANDTNTWTLAGMQLAHIQHRSNSNDIVEKTNYRFNDDL